MNIKTISLAAAQALLLVMSMPGWSTAQNLEAGKALYAKNCAVCHQASGQGQDGLAPSLTSNPGRYAGNEAGRKLLPQIAIYGMLGEIESGGKHYNGNMPNFRYLSDADLAAVLNYIALDLSATTKGADTKPYSADEIGGQRGQTISGSEVRHQRVEVLKAISQ
jgi:mono/diheme cytochrome c family protein